MREQAVSTSETFIAVLESLRVQATALVGFADSDAGRLGFVIVVSSAFVAASTSGTGDWVHDNLVAKNKPPDCELPKRPQPMRVASLSAR